MAIKMKLPHWLIVLFTTLTALAASGASIPAFAEYAPVLSALAVLFGAAAGTTGIVSHSAVVATPSPLGSTTGMGSRGFVEARALLVVAVLSIVGCAAALAAVPAVSALGLCVFEFVEQHPGLTLLEYVSQSMVSCGGDALTILDQILASDSPAVKPLQAEARALRAAGGEKLQEFAAATHARAGAIRAGTK